MNNLSTQIATTREQSERLLSMGVKPETADMFYALENGTQSLCALPYTDGVRIPFDDVIPAWSLSRLISMMPKMVNRRCSEYYFAVNACYGESFSIAYDRDDGFDCIDVLESKEDESLIECCVSMIDWLIKNNHFNKEYYGNTGHKV